MIELTSLDEIRLDACWLTIGIFDGMHLGHQVLLEHLVDGSHRAGLPAVVLTFQPHPAVVLGGNRDFKVLNTHAERLALLAGAGVDTVITQHFDRKFAAQTPREFMQHLVRSAQLKHLVIGYDTALGRDRQGDAAHLTELGIDLGYTVEVTTAFRLEAEIISSSAIRTLLRQGDVTRAAQMLGRSYSVSGLVVHGDGRGKHINLPTANIHAPADKVIPAKGIYATWIQIGSERFRGATNIGTNPTFTPEKQTESIETHVLDFDRSLYGQEVKVEFIAHLREEIKFTSVGQLLEQIQLDIQKTRTILA